MDATTLPARPTPAEVGAGFADQMAAADAAIRRERRPLPAHDLSGCNYRKWSAAVLAAELKHATDDAWRCIHDLGLGLLFNGQFDRDGEVAQFRFQHEREAGVAAVWLLHLQTHDSDRYGVWARWLVMNRHERIAWARRRRELLHCWLAAMRFYEAQRAEIDRPIARAA